MRRVGLLFVSVLFGLMDSGLAAELVRYVRTSPASGSSAAVVVDRLPFGQTVQILAWDALGNVVSPGDVTVQTEQVLRNLDAALKGAKTSSEQTVKLNVYVTKDEFVSAVQQVLAKRFAGPAKPAVCFVTTALPQPDALVAMDALAVITAEGVGDGVRTVSGSNETPGNPGTAFRSRTSVMPLGSRLYISGQADKAETLAVSTKLTLSGLENSLKHCGRSKSDVVQVKCFLAPMSQVADVDREIEQFFAPLAVPAVSHVEWESTLPIEIEMVAFAGVTPKLPLPEPIEYVTHPSLTTSPVFSRIARVHHPSMIFIGGLMGKSGTDGTQQIEHVFGELGSLLKETGSDFKHLAKATYYVSQAEAGQKLNELRPKFYDRERPPAASKAQVKGVGLAGAGLTLDMIAVPAP